MKKKVELTIITPVYNGEKFIESCLQNVIEQNCPFAEHLIMDGGSKDRTVKILQDYSEKYPHIRYISEKDNGQSDAMNKGIKSAKGSIISFLNVDDFYEPNALNDALKIIETLDEPAFLVGNCNVWDSLGALISVNKPKVSVPAIIYEHKANDNWNFPFNPSAYFYHKSIHEKIGYYDVNNHYSMDFSFLLKSFQFAKVKYVDKVFGDFRLVEHSKTKRMIETGRSYHEMSKVLYQHINDSSFQDKIKYYIVFFFGKVISFLKYYIRNPHNFMLWIKSKF